MKLFFLGLAFAHAGWWGDFCERHLIADDPYQYEQTEAWQLRRQIQVLAHREWQGTISKSDRKQLEIMRRELKRREDYNIREVIK